MRIQLIDKYWAYILAIGAAVAAIVVLYIGLAQSIWFDEAYSLSLARLSVDQLVHLTSVDVHPPLYYLILKAWGEVFGWSDWALRSLGALLGGLLVVTAGMLVKKLFGTKTMLVTLPFIVFAPFLLRYGFELRMYALAAIIGILATSVMVSALGATRRRTLLWIVYGALLAVGLYTVYYIALLWVAHLAWLIYEALKNKKTVWRQPWIFGYVTGVVLFLPWLPVFLTQLTNGALANISQPMTIENLIGIVSFGLLYRPTWQLGVLGAIVMVAVFSVFVWMGLNTYRISTRREKIKLALLVSYVAVPVIVITVVSLVKPFYVERYFAPVLIGGYSLIGVSLAIIGRQKVRQALFAGLFLFAVQGAGVLQLSQTGNFNFQRLETPTVRQVAKQIGHCQPGHVILAADPYVAIELQQYVSAECELYFYDQSPTLSGGYASLSGSKMQVYYTAVLDRFNTITYVYYGDPALEPPHKYDKSEAESYGSLSLQQWRLSAE